MVDQTTAAVDTQESVMRAVIQDSTGISVLTLAVQHVREKITPVIATLGNVMEPVIQDSTGINV